jgi:hypothetical protein
MAPHRQWCYNKQKGTHWYDGPTGEYAWLYRFVRDHANLFDGYTAIAPVAVVYDNAARRENQGNIEPICTALAEANIPFTVAVAGDNWLDYQLDDDRLKQFKQVIIREPLAMDAAQLETVESVRGSGRLVTWKDASTLAHIDQPVTLDGSDHVMVIPRTCLDRPDSPLVVHLLNRQYDGQRDRMVPQGPFTVRLDQDLVGKFTARGATLYAPRAEPVALRLRHEARDICLEIPALDLWGIITIHNH